MSLRRAHRSRVARFFAQVLVVAVVLVSLPRDVDASIPRGPLDVTKTAFGELTSHTGTDPQPYAFTGEPLDLNSGFQYHRARWMDPRTGRFAGMDPFGGRTQDPVTLHRYLYTGADPVNKLDPNGENFFVAGLAATAVFGAIAAIASLSASIGPGSRYLGLPGPLPPATWFSQSGVRFLKRWEGFEPNLYSDIGGNCTIGYGELVHLAPCNGTEPAEFQQGITEARASQLLHNRIVTEFLPGVRSAVRVPLFQHQLDALVSFVYNIGVTAFTTSGPGGGPSGVLNALNTRRLFDVPDEIRRWVFSNGRVSNGLVSRRNAEATLFRIAAYQNP